MVLIKFKIHRNGFYLVSFGQSWQMKKFGASNLQGVPLDAADVFQVMQVVMRRI